MEAGMKLWQKIFLCTFVLVMIAIGITSVLLTRNNYELLIEQQRENIQFQHGYLASNIKNKLIAERLKRGVIVLGEQDILAVIQEAFKEQENQTFPKVSFHSEDETIFFENIGIVLGKELFQEAWNSDNMCIQIKEEDEKVYLSVASKIKMENKYYVFTSYHDITFIYQIHREQVTYIQQISTICSTGIALFLLVLVKILLLPLRKINKGTKAIAEGEYQKRIKVSGHHELSELGRNMNHMADAVETNVMALEAVAENRKQFIANLSHEMKTPLTSIVGFADIIRIKKEITKEELEDYVAIIAEEAKRLRTLSGKLMELITVGETNLEWKKFSIHEVIEEIGITLEPILKTRNLSLQCQCEEGELQIDKELFKSLCYNLLDNAMKASREEDIIEINGMFQKGEFVLNVKDNGIGISKEELDKITEPFYMVDKARTRENGGAGLGLSLCQEIAKVHQGSLRIESELGKGTCVTIRMKGGDLDES